VIIFVTVIQHTVLLTAACALFCSLCLTASVSLSLSVFPFSDYCVIMICSYIVIGYELWKTFLSRSLPFFINFNLLLLFVYCWQIKYLIWYVRKHKRRQPVIVCVVMESWTQESSVTVERYVDTQHTSPRQESANFSFLSKQWRNTHWTRLDKCQGPPGPRGPQAWP